MKIIWVVLAGLGVSGMCVSPPRAFAVPLAATTVASTTESHNWDAPPAEFRPVEREGFHDGIEAAQKDYDDHRAPDVESRGEYRHPHVTRDEREDYREGFRAGYERATSHLNSLHY